MPTLTLRLLYHLGKRFKDCGVLMLRYTYVIASESHNSRVAHSPWAVSMSPSVHSVPPPETWHTSCTAHPQGLHFLTAKRETPEWMRDGLFSLPLHTFHAYQATTLVVSRAVTGFYLELFLWEGRVHRRSCTSMSGLKLFILVQCLEQC
jgi:hypothetical protein